MEQRALRVQLKRPKAGLIKS